jgi:hypothetical protein
MERFVEESRKYCKLIEECENIPNDKFVYECLYSLSILYNLGIQLPDIEPATEGVFTATLESKMAELIDKLKERDPYAHVFDPYEDKEVCMTSLSDDLADIYSDIKEPLILYDKNEKGNQQDAIWQWRFNIHGHCGDHIVSALTALHRIHVDYGISEK